MARLPRLLKHFNLYIDGEEYAGRADSLTLPSLVFTMEDHRAAGMDGVKRLEMGMDAMTSTFIISDYTPALISLMGRDDVPIVARGSVHAQGLVAPEPVVINTRGMFSGIEFAEWRGASKSTQTMTSELSYFRYRQADVEYCEIDVVNMVRKFGGVDQMAQHRTNIGM